MRLLCPDCRRGVDPDSLACPGGHRFHRRHGVVVLLGQEFGRRLEPFAARLAAIRAAKGPVLDASAFEELPFGDAVDGDLEWRLRRYDLAVLSRLLRPHRPRRVLDVGAWNGWLSHRLAARGHDVTAVDYFADGTDGLGARRFYSTTWRAIQMDITDLTVLDGTWDVIVVNRCLQFFTDPIAFVAAAKRRVAAGGMLVLTGLQLFREPGTKAARVDALRQHYRERFDFELFLRPTKGYLDWNDRAALMELGIELRSYRPLGLANLRARVARSKPSHAYGLWCPGARSGAVVDATADARRD